jgi:dienelactone hydrolase
MDIKIEQVLNLENELSRRNADWQVNVYGNGTNHGFTVPGARYHPVSARRAWRDMRNMLQEAFDPNALDTVKMM